MVLCRKLDKRPPPCQKGRADCFGRAGGKEKAFGLLQAKGNTEEKKFHVEHWMVLCRELDKRPPPCQTGRAGFLAEPEEKKKPLVCCEPKAIPKKEKVPRGTLKGTLQELDKRPPPCQTGRAGFLAEPEEKKKAFGPQKAKGTACRKRPPIGGLSACRKRSPFGGLFLVLREKMRYNGVG